jgi:hypothetical protein
MQQIVLCPFCKKTGKQTAVQVAMLGPENRFDDGECPVCQKKFAGRILVGETEEGTSVPKIEVQKKTVRTGSYGTVMQPIS